MEERQTLTALALTRTALVAVSLILVVGCESLRRPERPSTGTVETRNNAASLLYDLLGDEKNVSKILIIKRDRRELHDVIKKVSTTAGAVHERLEKMAREDPTLNLKETALPSGERATREAESKARAKELLHSSGADFEFNLLMTQAEALGYARYLALVAAQSEASPAARESFLKMSEQMKAVHGEVITLLRAGQNVK